MGQISSSDIQTNPAWSRGRKDRAGEGVRRVDGPGRRPFRHFSRSGKTTRRRAIRIVAGVLLNARIEETREPRGEQQDRLDSAPHDNKQKRTGPGQKKPRKIDRIADTEKSNSPLPRHVAGERTHFVKRLHKARRWGGWFSTAQLRVDHARPPGKTQQLAKNLKMLQARQLLNARAQGGGKRLYRVYCHRCCKAKRLHGRHVQHANKHLCSTEKRNSGKASLERVRILLNSKCATTGASLNCVSLRVAPAIALENLLVHWVAFVSCAITGYISLLSNWSNILFCNSFRVSPVDCSSLFCIRALNSTAENGASILQCSGITRGFHCPSTVSGNCSTISVYTLVCVSVDCHSGDSFYIQLAHSAADNNSASMSDLHLMMQKLQVEAREKKKSQNREASIKAGESAGTDADRRRQQESRDAAAKKERKVAAAADEKERRVRQDEINASQAWSSLQALQREFDSARDGSLGYELADGNLQLAVNKRTLLQICLTSTGKNLLMKEIISISQFILGRRAFLGEPTQQEDRIARSLGQDWNTEARHARFEFSHSSNGSQLTGLQLSKGLAPLGINCTSMPASKADMWPTLPKAPGDNRETRSKFTPVPKPGFTAEISCMGEGRAAIKSSSQIDIGSDILQVTILPLREEENIIELVVEAAELPNLRRIAWIFSVLNFTTADVERYLEACILENEHLLRLRKNILGLRIDRARKSEGEWRSLYSEALGSSDTQNANNGWTNAGAPRILLAVRDMDTVNAIMSEGKAMHLFLGPTKEQAIISVQATPKYLGAPATQGTGSKAADNLLRTAAEKALEAPNRFLQQLAQLVKQLEEDAMEDAVADTACRIMYQRLIAAKTEFESRPLIWSIIKPFVDSFNTILRPNPVAPELWISLADEIQDLNTVLQETHNNKYSIVSIMPDEKWPLPTLLFGRKCNAISLPLMMERVLASNQLETLAVIPILSQKGTWKNSKGTWDQAKGVFRAAIPEAAEENLRRRMTGEKLVLSPLCGSTTFTVVIKWQTETQGVVSSAEDEKRLCLEILKFLELGNLLHCPKFVDENPDNGNGTTFDRLNFTKVSEFKAPTERIPGDIREITSMIPDCSKDLAESTMKCIGLLHSEGKIRAPYGASNDKVVYVAESLAGLLPDTFHWSDILEREGAILDTTDAIFATVLEAEVKNGLWTSADMANIKGQHLEDAPELISPAMKNEKVQDRRWQRVLREHPYAMIAEGQHGTRVICGLRDQKVWSIMEKQGSAIIVSNTSPFLSAILRAGPDSGVRADEPIIHDDLVFAQEEISEFAETLAQEMQKSGGFALVKQPPGLGAASIISCRSADQRDNQERRILPQISADERFSKSKLPFRAIDYLENEGRAKIARLQDGFGVVTATIVENARPSPVFTILEEFGNLLEESFIDRSFKSKFAKVVFTQQYLDSLRRKIFFDRVEECIKRPLLMRGWTISTHESKVELRAGEYDTSRPLRSQYLDAELAIRHPWYSTKEGVETFGDLFTEENTGTRQLESGVLSLNGASMLDAWPQDDPRLHNWDPTKVSFDDLLQQEATAALEELVQDGSILNVAKANTESMICDNDNEADTESGAGAGAASGTAGSGDIAAAETSAGASTGRCVGTNADARATEKRTAQRRSEVSDQCFKVRVKKISASSEREGSEISNTQNRNSGEDDGSEWVPLLGDSEPTVTMILKSEETVSLLLYAGRVSGGKFDRVTLRCVGEQEQTITLDPSSELRIYEFQPISTSTMELKFQTDTPHEGEAGAQIIELWSDSAAGKVLKKSKRTDQKKL